MKNTIGIIMGNVGRLPLLINTLSSLESYLSRDIRLCLISNGYTEETREYLLDEWSKKISIVYLPDNYGKPYAWNLGLAYFGESCIKLEIELPDYILFCDDDIEFLPKWDVDLLHRFELFYSEGLRVLSGYLWKPGSKPGVEVLEKEGLEIQKNSHPAGCCLLMRYKDAKEWIDLSTEKLIGNSEGPLVYSVMKKGFYAASVYPESLIEHIGQGNRTFETMQGKLRPKVINMKEEL